MTDPADTITALVNEQATAIRELTDSEYLKVRDAQEAYLRSVWLESGLSIEEFAREYVVEEHPVEYKEDRENNAYSMVHTILCRPKTDEEKAAELMAHADEIRAKIERGEFPPTDENGFYKI